MINITDKSLCSGCYSCINACPKNCIEMKLDDEGFWYPYVDKNKCTNCGLCENKCPIIINIERKNDYNSKAFACYNNNENIRINSSSGGIFDVLAYIIIENGGEVYGAAYDSAFSVYHTCINNKECISELRGSKYLQSRVGNIYEEIKNKLDNNKLVYFSGTPCQIDGLFAYLGKRYDNLITQDIICHGVPSPKLWRYYLNYRDKNPPNNINFRNKNKGWDKYELWINYSNYTYKCPHYKDAYFQAFLSNLCLRPSCYNCKSKSLQRTSDITLADFWGIENIDSIINDNKGVSLVLINSEKGNSLFNKISNNISMKEVNLNEAVKCNPSAYKSVDRPNNRDAFMKEIFISNFDVTVKKYIKISFFKRIRMKLFQVIRKWFKL